MRILLFAIFSIISVPTLFAQDGSFIVFNSGRKTSGRDIYRCNPDGSDLKKLTSFNSRGHYPHANGPKISPDGKQILLHIDMDGHDRFTIWIMDIDGSNLTKLTTQEGLYPSWSKDGKRIAYSGRRQGVWEIMTMDLTTKKEEIISHYRANGKRPGWGAHTSWSPDGGRLAYSHVREKVTYTVNSKGGTPTQITPAGSKSTYPTWSEDGSSILMNFRPEGSSSYQAAQIQLNNREISYLADNLVSYSPVSWSPDEKSIVFMGMVNDQQEIFVKDLTSGKEVNITNNNAFDAFANWGPVK